MQDVINVILALTSICGVVMSAISLLQIRRQMQRVLLLCVKQDVLSLARIPDKQGGRSSTPVHVFIIHIVNGGLLPVTLKSASFVDPAGGSLAQAFSERRDRQIPLELAPGDDLEVHVDAYDVLKALKQNGVIGRSVLRGCVTTP